MREAIVADIEQGLVLSILSSFTPHGWRVHMLWFDL